MKILLSEKKYNAECRNCLLKRRECRGGRRQGEIKFWGWGRETAKKSETEKFLIKPKLIYRNPFSVMHRCWKGGRKEEAKTNLFCLTHAPSKPPSLNGGITTVICIYV